MEPVPHNRHSAAPPPPPAFSSLQESVETTEPNIRRNGALRHFNEKLALWADGMTCYNPDEPPNTGPQDLGLQVGLAQEIRLFRNDVANKTTLEIEEFNAHVCEQLPWLHWEPSPDRPPPGWA